MAKQHIVQHALIGVLTLLVLACGKKQDQEIVGCTEPSALNFNPAATVDDGSCTFQGGCTDPLALNYNNTATLDDGSCAYEEGCTDSTALNYNPEAVVDDGSCEFQEGCTDPLAYNYDPLAVVDDGSCVYDLLFKDFQDGELTSFGWMNHQVVSSPGDHNWSVSDAGSPGDYYAVMSAWNGSSVSETDVWLVSPLVDFSGITNPVLSFRNARNFAGNQLQLLVSSDYDGTSLPALSGNWVDLTANAFWSTGGFAWASSGSISLAQFAGANAVHIAFRYTSTSQSPTWQIDDIVVDDI